MENLIRMKGTQQSDRLTTQQKAAEGCIGIFEEEAQKHDQEVYNTSTTTLKRLEREFPKLSFRYRRGVTKKEINEALQKIDSRLGQTLFVPSARIKPDGGIIEVKDDYGNNRYVTFEIHINNNLEVFPKYGSETSTWEGINIGVSPNETIQLETVVNATDFDGLTYQWYKEIREYYSGGGYGSYWVKINGAEEGLYTTEPITGNTSYYCQITDKYGNTDRKSVV